MNFNSIMIIRKALIYILLGILSSSWLYADDGGSDEPFNPSETIIHHILDTHDWHLLDWPSKDEQGNKIYKPIALHLPWLFFSSESGVHFYSNTHAMHEEGKFVSYHEKPYALAPGATIPADYHGHGELSESLIDHDHHVYDFSPTKGVVQILLVGIFLILIFRAVAKGYQKNAGKAPSGIQSFFEPIIVFVRDDVAKEYLGDKALKFTPYLLSLFFFIWFSNLFGLTPLNSNIMGNISVTAALAVLTFFIVQFNGTKDYWRHVFAMPGVPIAVVPLMTLIEIISLFVKPFALAIRLFANISAGHFMILSLVSLIFVMGDSGKSVGGALGIMPITVLFTIAIFTLEMVVAIIQAYIFTLLTAVFISMALESHDDHH